MPKDKFFLVEKVRGYWTKPDKTNMDPRYLVGGSQNVIINDQERVGTRGGYELFGAANTAENPVESSFDWETSHAETIHLRGLSDELQFYAGTVGGVEFNEWTVLKDGWTAVDFCFTTWWDTGEDIDLLLFVNGGDKIYDWSGATASLASATSNTITKNGTTTWAQERFLTSGTRQVIINGTTYTYTGGETTTTLTGVTPDPSGEAADSLVFQAIRENDNQPADGVINDGISVLNNQVHVGSNQSREIYISKDSDFTDYTYGTPRVMGEGGLVVMDNVWRGFARQQDNMYIASGQDDWYEVRFEKLEISSGAVAETITVNKLQTQSGQAARSQDLIAEAGDYVIFINFNNEAMMLGKMESLEEPSLLSLSDPIKPDFDDEDFTGGHIKPHKNRIYISAPANDNVYIVETRQRSDGELERFWQSPQVLPVGKFMVRSGDIYGHSSAVSETYKLFTGTNDNSKSFRAVAALVYRSYGRRDMLKILDEWLTEGYISANTTLTMKLRYEWGGATQELEYDIDGADDDILFEPAVEGALGDSPLGDSPLGDQLDEDAGNPKFRVVQGIACQDFFEIQVVFETDEVDYQWQILATGGNVRFSVNKPISIQK